MRAKWVFLAGLGAGYVLGSRAGRERYEQLIAALRRVKDSPTVQEAAGVVQAQAGRLAHTGREMVSERIADSKLGHTRIGERLFGAPAYGSKVAGGESYPRRHNGAGHG